MGKKKWGLSIALIVCITLSVVSYELLSVQAPSDPTDVIEPTTTPTVTPNHTDTANPSTTANPTVAPTNGNIQPQNNPTPAATSNPTTNPSPLPDVSSPHEKDHEAASDYLWNSNEVISITLNGNTITATSSNSTIIEGSRVTINASGTFKVSGTLNDGQLIINTKDKDPVRVILSGADITSSTSTALYFTDAKKTILILDDNTINSIRDTGSTSTSEPNAAIFSSVDLTIYGNGQLNVYGNNNDAIASKDGLIIKSGTINVNSLDDGIRGKDYVIMRGGKVTVTAGGDGLKADNAANTSRGYIQIENGALTITSGRDAIDAQTDVTITGGQITATAGGGSQSSIPSGASAKGIKGLINVTITTGTFTIDSADDCLHSNRTVTVNGGTFNLRTGDDAIHADKLVTINGGTIEVPSSYEGIESEDLAINGGTIYINSSDDGINGAGGNDGSGFQPIPGIPGPGGGGFVPGNRTLTINGGYIYIEAVGDGIDVNGPITMTAGYVVVQGPVFNGNSAIDWEGGFKMTGGFIVGVGSSGMSMTAGPTSTQYALLINFRTAKAPSTLIHIETAGGAEVITFQAIKQYQSIALCAPSLTKGTTYNVYLGGSDSGTLKDGVYQNGVYTPGTKVTTFTVNNIVTKLTNI